MAIVEDKTESIGLRTFPSFGALLKKAAMWLRRRGTGTPRDSGFDSDEDDLADQRIFRLNDQQWQAFQDALNRPPVEKPRLAKLLAEKSVLEQPLEPKPVSNRKT